MNSKFVFGLGLFMMVVSLVAGCKWVAGNKIVNSKTENNAQAGNGDADFVRAAIRSNIAEIKFAELALTKSADPKIREIATVLRDDHEQSLQSLLTIADHKNITMPESSSTSVEGKTSLLADASEDFDKKWCAEMIGKHEMNFQVLESVWESTTDDEIRDLVNAALPHLISHLESLVEYQEHYGLNHPETLAAPAGPIAEK